MTEPAQFNSFLTFRTNHQRYALPASQIAEIIPVPAVTRLPHGPAPLLGMASLRGSVIAVASLRALLGHEAEIAGATARAIVLDRSPIAITVDAVESLVSIDSEGVEIRQSKRPAGPGELLNGEIGNADAAAKILDMPGLLARAFVPRKSSGGPTTPNRQIFRQSVDKRQTTTDLTQAATRALVTFEVANQTYAFDLADVWEIIAMPEAATAPAEVRMAAYRDSALPLVSLRSRLGFSFESEPHHKIIVVSVAGIRVGLICDRVRAVVHADLRAIAPAPALLSARAGGEARINAIYHGKDGLVSLLATAGLLSDAELAKLGGRATEPAPAVASAETLQYLVFRLGAEEFALPIAAVDEVAAVPIKITRLPRTPKALSGLVNLRGEVLPVIDRHGAFGLPETRDGRQRLVVMRAARCRAGLIVDGVSELRVTAAAVEPAPWPGGAGTRGVRGVLNPEPGRRIPVLDPATLLTRSQNSLLPAFSPAPAKAP
jgi:purine-binding chemotaxis protein CheW